MRIIDSHVHFPSKNFLGDGWKVDKRMKIESSWLDKEREKWRLAWRFPPMEEIDDQDKLIELWYEEAEKYDIDKIVFVTGGGNENLLEIVNSHPDKFIGYCHHNPEEENAADTLKEYINKGLKGYKILAPKIDTMIADKKFYPVWETAQSLDIPILWHFGIMGGAGGLANHININPMAFHDVAKDFPKLKFIIPHFGCGYVFETLQLCWTCPNIYIDTSGSNQWMRWMPYELNLEILFRKYFETIGPERILFGTDSSWFGRGFADKYLNEQMRSMVYVGYKPEEIDMVLYKNISEILKLK